MQPTRPDPQDKHEIALAAAEAYGVDLSLLQENLRLSPTERLEKLQGLVELATDLRAAYQAAAARNVPNAP